MTCQHILNPSYASTSLSIPFQDNQLLLGIWQGIYLMEFRKNAGPRSIVASPFF